MPFPNLQSEDEIAALQQLRYPERLRQQVPLARATAVEVLATEVLVVDQLVMRVLVTILKPLQILAPRSRAEVLWA